MPSTTSPTSSSSTTPPPATATLLDVAQRNYADETARTNTLDTKVGISLPLISGYFLTIIASLIENWPAVFSIRTELFRDVFIPSITVLSYSGALVLSLIALYLMISVISTKEYQHVDIHEFYNKGLLTTPYTATASYLIGKYIAATDHNKLQNDARIKPYCISWTLVIISIALFLVYNIAKALLPIPSN